LLIGIGIAWWAHEFRGASWRVLVPAVLVLAGVLMLVARRPGIPERRRGKDESS
jgi:uncharacterized protein YaaW (UPF0174 family)